MYSGYLGASIMCPALLMFAAAYWLLRGKKPNRYTDNESLVALFSFILTTMLSLGTATFAANAYFTDITSTIVSVILVAIAAAVLVSAIWKTKVYAGDSTTEAAGGTREIAGPAPVPADPAPKQHQTGGRPQSVAAALDKSPMHPTFSLPTRS